jgi:hypothetical protein
MVASSREQSAELFFDGFLHSAHAQRARAGAMEKQNMTTADEDVQRDLRLYITAAMLQQFRQRMERKACRPACEIDTTAAWVLDDLCNFLGMTPLQRQCVVGPLRLPVEGRTC